MTHAPKELLKGTNLSVTSTKVAFHLNNCKFATVAVEANGNLQIIAQPN
jgi:hypothetical protein